MGKENREVKNSVLVDLFCDDETAEKNDIELFNALHEEPLPEGTKIERIRVDNVLYMDFQNDVSFGVEGKVLVMGEHQSTINHNMPLRSLMYIGRAYEKIVPMRDRYKRGLVKLPKPELTEPLLRGILLELLFKKATSPIKYGSGKDIILV